MKREELITSSEYLMVQIQHNLYEMIEQYMNDKNLNRKQLADELGVTKGYVTQLLNGEFDHRISKFIDLSLKIGKVPFVTWKDVESVILEDKLRTQRIKASGKTCAVYAITSSANQENFDNCFYAGKNASQTQKAGGHFSANISMERTQFKTASR